MPVIFLGFRMSGGARQCAKLMQIKEFCRTPLRLGRGMTGGLGGIFARGKAWTAAHLRA
ncbi:hypothetical protein ACSSVY_001607 [Roseovarius sp. MBR-51]